MLVNFKEDRVIKMVIKSPLSALLGAREVIPV
jgi:hypothetical protein